MCSQIHDKIILDGKENRLIPCRLLIEHPEIVRVADEEIDYESNVRSTACCRRYLATWEIRDDRLFLIHIEGYFKLSEDSPIFAGWVKNRLTILKGKCLIAENIGFEQIYEEDLIIKMNHGIVMGTEIINNHERAKIAHAEMINSLPKYLRDKCQTQ